MRVHLNTSSIDNNAVAPIEQNMNKQNLQNYKGIFLAIISTFLGSLATIFYKPIMIQGVTPTMIGLIESFAILLLLLITRPWRLIKSHKRIQIPIILSGICQAVGVISFIFGLNFSDPTTFSFLTRNQAIFSILIGYFFLGERNNMLKWIFIITAMLGSIMICYADLGTISLQGIMFALLLCISYSLRNYIMRKHKRLPILINIFYGYLFTLIFLIIFSILKHNAIYELPNLFTIFAIAVIGIIAVLGTLYFFQLAFRYDKLSIITSIRLFSPFIITIYFGWSIRYNYPTLKIFGIGLMTLSIITLFYSYRTTPNISHSKPAHSLN